MKSFDEGEDARIILLDGTKVVGANAATAVALIAERRKENFIILLLF